MNDPKPAPLYESAKKIYPREIGGKFAKLSKLATTTLLGLFYAMPWLLWDDRQAFLECLLNARDVFYLSYVGRGVRDDSAIPLRSSRPRPSRRTRSMAPWRTTWNSHRNGCVD